MKNYDGYKEILLGKKIGSGCFRDVYNCRLNEKYVVKVLKDDADYSFANVMEWKIWEEIQNYKKMSKWFAPCEFITDDGKILIQEKAVIALPKDYPSELPNFFRDIKIENFGFIGKQFVCFDYNTLPLSYGFSLKMKKVKWE